MFELNYRIVHNEYDDFVGQHGFFQIKCNDCIVALSDVESYNTWIVFQKRNEKVIISILKAKKEQSSQDIEFLLKDPEAGEWINQTVFFEQLQQEVMEKGRAYIKDILINNKENELVVKIKESFEEILRYLPI